MHWERSILILKIGFIDMKKLRTVQAGLLGAFPSTCEISEKAMPIPEDTYDPTRRQYHSTRILERVERFTRDWRADYVLGVTDVDLSTPSVDFVFGEAYSPGRVAVISLFRLRRDFCGLPPNDKIYSERAIKESIHEVGHAIGLKHCRDHSCVMSFSGSTHEIDRKNPKFCAKCSKLLRKFSNKRVAHTGHI